MNTVHENTVSPGDLVKVYQKPFTDEQFEGIAKIIKVLHGDDETGIHCEVKFQISPRRFELQSYNRWVNVRNLVSRNG